MKLAFCLFKYYSYGGLERDFLRIAQGFLTKGHEIHVFTMEWQGAKPQGFNIHFLPRKGLSNHIRALNFAKALQHQLKKGQFDCVIGFNRMPGLDVYFAADLCFVKTFQEKHAFWLRYLSRYKSYQKLEQTVFEPTLKNKILVLTEEVKNNYQTVYKTPEERFISIPAGIPRLNLEWVRRQQIAAEIKRDWSIPLEHQLLLHVGSDFKRKGLDRSLRAIAALPAKEQQNLHFFIIGKGKNEVYQQLVKKLGITADIRFLGTRDDVQTLMQTADGLLHPAYFETAGMVLIEAISSGLPVIVTANCGYAFHVANAKAGIIIPQPFQQQQMNQQLKVFLEANKNTWQQHALDYAKQTDLYSMVDKVVKLVERDYIYTPETLAANLSIHSAMGANHDIAQID